MARKKSNGSASNASVSKSVWRGFANVSLTAEDKKRIREDPYQERDLWEGIARVLSAGHKITLSYSSESGNTSVSLTGTLDTCPNAGLTLTSTGKDALTALNVALYKHFDIAKGIWSDASDDDDDMS